METVNSQKTLVNNAGTAFPDPLELLSLDDLRAQIEIIGEAEKMPMVFAHKS